MVMAMARIMLISAMLVLSPVAMLSILPLRPKIMTMMLYQLQHHPQLQLQPQHKPQFHFPQQTQRQHSTAHHPAPQLPRRALLLQLTSPIPQHPAMTLIRTSTHMSPISLAHPTSWALSRTAPSQTPTTPPYHRLSSTTASSQVPAMSPMTSSYLGPRMKRYIRRCATGNCGLRGQIFLVGACLPIIGIFGSRLLMLVLMYRWRLSRGQGGSLS